MIVKRPKYLNISLEQCLALKGDNLRFEEKMDGCWAQRGNLIGEEMADGSFYVFDINLPGSLSTRMAALDRFNVLRPATGMDGSFAEEVLARGGEGIVIKDLDAAFGTTWLRCKRVETFDLTVTEKRSFTSSVRLADGRNDRGWCPCRAAFNRVEIGDIVEVSAFSLTKNGKLREPRFVRSRFDKVHAP